MANAEIECIVRDTKELMFQIGSGDRRLDEMIRRVNTVNEKIACMREYQNIMNAVNAYTINGSRRTVLLEELQRENRQILAYHEENRNLREAIDESMETLAKVMARHRLVMARMNRLSKQPSFKDVTGIFPDDCDNTARDKERFRKLVTETSSFMKECEDSTSVDLQKLSQLLQENQVLREMLSTAAISTPGVRSVFAQAMTELKRKITNGIPSDLDTGSDTDDRLNETVMEKKHERE
uniref:FGFR1 oncogene partner 2 homolog n=1 Tax=Haemonchus contortus TaxID=6289 RepID=A0A7I5E921_HAECO